MLAERFCYVRRARMPCVPRGSFRCLAEQEETRRIAKRPRQSQKDAASLYLSLRSPEGAVAIRSPAVPFLPDVLPGYGFPRSAFADLGMTPETTGIGFVSLQAPKGRSNPFSILFDRTPGDLYSTLDRYTVKTIVRISSTSTAITRRCFFRPAYSAAINSRTNALIQK